MKYWHPHLPFGQYISVSTLVEIIKTYCVSQKEVTIRLNDSVALFSLSGSLCFTGVILSIQWKLLYCFHWVVLCVALVSSCLSNEDCCTISTEWYYVLHWCHPVYPMKMVVLFPLSGIMCCTGVILSIQWRLLYYFYWVVLCVALVSSCLSNENGCTISTEWYYVLHWCHPVYPMKIVVLFPLSGIMCCTGVILSIQWRLLYCFHWVVLCVSLVIPCLSKDNFCTVSNEWYALFHWCYPVCPMQVLLCFHWEVFCASLVFSNLIVTFQEPQLHCVSPSFKSVEMVGNENYLAHQVNIKCISEISVCAT